MTPTILSHLLGTPFVISMDRAYYEHSNSILVENPWVISENIAQFLPVNIIILLVVFGMVFLSRQLFEVSKRWKLSAFPSLFVLHLTVFGCSYPTGIFAQELPPWVSKDLEYTTVGNSAVGLHNLTLFAVGTSFDKVLILDTHTYQWSGPYFLSESRNNITAVSVGDNAYFVGGSIGQNPCNRVDVYNSYSKNWTYWDVEEVTLSVCNPVATTALQYALFTEREVGLEPPTTKNYVYILDTEFNTWWTQQFDIPLKNVLAASAGRWAVFYGEDTSDSGHLHIFNATAISGTTEWVHISASSTIPDADTCWAVRQHSIQNCMFNE